MNVRKVGVQIVQASKAKKMVGGLIKKCIKKTTRNYFLFVFIVRRKFFLTPYLSDTSKTKINFDCFVQNLFLVP